MRVMEKAVNAAKFVKAEHFFGENLCLFCNASDLTQRAYLNPFEMGVLLLDLVSQDVFIKTEIGLIESLFQEGLVQCLPLYAKYASMNWLLFATNSLRWRFVVNMVINLRDS
jgi:hypothetical protein